MIDPPVIEQKQQSRLILAGNLVAKPHIRYRANPVIPVAEFVVATNHTWFDKKTNSYKDWTTFHPCHFEGQDVEEHFLYADKGQFLFLQGNLATITLAKGQKTKDLVQVETLTVLGRGVHSGINQLFCHATISSSIKLVTTESNSLLAEFQVTVNQAGFQNDAVKVSGQKIERSVHLWGKSAQYIHDKCQPGTEVLIEGALNYQANDKSKQFIDAKKVIICPK
ncbi:single-stranded DNA-binding protein [Thalassotalea aquiviva]|uniref:single-stranded DNA-binding protein n=1 Tax=Thalassotalea aquiviva TaxID=3242415 RepID=UPI00352AC742